MVRCSMGEMLHLALQVGATAAEAAKLDALRQMCETAPAAVEMLLVVVIPAVKAAAVTENVVQNPRKTAVPALAAAVGLASIAKASDAKLAQEVRTSMAALAPADIWEFGQPAAVLGEHVAAVAAVAAPALAYPLC